MWTQNVNNFGEVGENEKQKKLNFGQEFYGNSNKVTIVKKSICFDYVVQYMHVD